MQFLKFLSNRISLNSIGLFAHAKQFAIANVY